MSTRSAEIIDLDAWRIARRPVGSMQDMQSAQAMSAMPFVFAWVPVWVFPVLVNQSRASVG